MQMRQLFRGLAALGFLMVGLGNSHAKDSELENAIREANCLTEAIYHEARGEVTGGQIMVGMVVLARAADPEYPNSICAVTKQKNAFSFTRDAKLLKRPIDTEAWNKAYGIARQLLREAWTKQLLPEGAGCVRMYKVADEKLSTLKKKDEKSLGIGKKKTGLSFFDKKLRPVFTIGSHTFYERKDGCKNPMPSIITADLS